MHLVDTLFLQSNGITGTLPEPWGEGMSNMQRLWLYGNSLSGTLPSSWSAMTLIEELSLGHTPSELVCNGGTNWPLSRQQRDHGKRYHLSGRRGRTSMNLFFGVTSLQARSQNPPEWSLWTSIDSLNLRSNRITGSLPEYWSKISALAYIELQQNLISGSPPPQWAALGSVNTLDHSDNQLVGSLPSAWWG